MIPARLVATDLSGMKCDGNRCTALIGEIGTWTACTIYAVRPLVCRDCLPGDDACTMARTRVGLPPVAMIAGSDEGPDRPSCSES